MTVREEIEEREKKFLSPRAALSVNSKGREVWEEPCDIRPVFQRDRDRILHCKSFRRMKHKTQVFLSPQGDHYRTRLTHTLEVSQTARTIAKALCLNEDLTEAIALGHDLGHTPFGHCGEKTLDRKMQESCGLRFRHNEQSVRIVELLEDDGKGLNLTWEVRDGIRNHQMSGMPATMEGRVVRLSDKIAYIHHDMDDAIRAHVLAEEDVPMEYREILGMSSHDRLSNMIHDVIANSMDSDDIRMSPDVERAMKGMRRFMYENVYINPEAKGEEGKATRMLELLFDHYVKNTDELPEQYRRMIAGGEVPERAVCDYIAGMTDQYAVAKFESLYVPKSWQVY